MTSQSIKPGVFFSPRADLPRGRHALSRAEANEVQKERLMAAFTELVAENGLAVVTIGDVVGRASVSRGAFYACFADLGECGDATYDRFISVLLERLGAAMDPTDHWHEFIESAACAYLGTLQSDPVVARAMQIEMDAAGKEARLRRRRALRLIADVITSRHEQLRAEDPVMGRLPAEAHLGHVYAIRQLACDILENETEPDLMALVKPIVQWIGATVNGAASVGDDATYSAS